VDLGIQDDGVGFDLEGVCIESLGLGIMRERAEAIGALLFVCSEEGQGTKIRVRWQPLNSIQEAGKDR
jgi:signal transduction histidine kinase